MGFSSVRLISVLIAPASEAVGIKIPGEHGVGPLAQSRRIVQVNLVSTFNVLRLAGEQMARTNPRKGAWCDGQHGFDGRL
jgi:hypothetical protein